MVGPDRYVCTVVVYSRAGCALSKGTISKAHIHIIDVNLYIYFDNFQVNGSVLKKGHLFLIPIRVPYGLAPALALELAA